MKMKELLVFGLEEAKFIRSVEDAQIFINQKLPFLVPRITGNSFKKTSVPPSLQVEPTNYCNVECISCPNKRMKRQKGYMDVNLFEKIMKDARKVGVKRIQLYLHGEPLLHPDIAGLISLVKQNGLGLSMATNGMLLDDRMADDLLNSGLNSGDYLLFSVLGNTKETHESIMKKANHELVENNILNLLEKRRKRSKKGPIIETIIYIMDENKNEIEDFVKKWRGVVDHVHPIGSISKSFRVSGKEVKIEEKRKSTCKNLWERMTIYWNGDVTTCNNDVEGVHVYGNIGCDSIEKLWKNEKLNYIKVIHKMNKLQNISLCKYCDM